MPKWKKCPKCDRWIPMTWLFDGKCGWKYVKSGEIKKKARQTTLSSVAKKKEKVYVTCTGCFMIEKCLVARINTPQYSGCSNYHKGGEV